MVSWTLSALGSKLTRRDPTFIRKFKSEHVVEVWATHITRGNKSVDWRALSDFMLLMKQEEVVQEEVGSEVYYPVQGVGCGCLDGAFLGADLGAAEEVVM